MEPVYVSVPLLRAEYEQLCAWADGQDGDTAAEVGSALVHVILTRPTAQRLRDMIAYDPSLARVLEAVVAALDTRPVA
jgi:hypothetical protein